MIDFGYCHQHTSNPGDPLLSPGRSGCLTIDYDGRRYYYRVPRGQVREFRAWAETAFQEGLTAMRITGNRRDGYDVVPR